MKAVIVEIGIRLSVLSIFLTMLVVPKILKPIDSPSSRSTRDMVIKFAADLESKLRAGEKDAVE